MFNLCENSAFARNEKKSIKVKGVKMTPDELEAINEMQEYYQEKYFSNLVRMGLKILYDDMINSKNKK